MLILQLILLLVGIYILAGLLFAIAFVLKGVDQIDETAAGASWGFRVIIIPGTAVFWPLLLKRWLSVTKTKMR
jgi:hypothetical protein